jgi:hypothetical protein
VNAHGRRTATRRYLHYILCGASLFQIFTGLKPVRFDQYIARLPHARKVEIAYTLLALGASRGGTDMLSCVDKLSPDEQETLGVITGLRRDYERSLGEKLDKLALFLLANPLPVTSNLSLSPSDPSHAAA